MFEPYDLKPGQAGILVVLSLDGEMSQRELAERQEKISTWLELMKADGINPEELLGDSSAAAPRAGKKTPAASGEI